MSNVTLTPTVGAATLAGQSPAMNITVSPNTAVAVLAGQAPVDVANSFVTPSVGAAAFASGGAAGVWPNSAFLFVTEYRSPLDHPISGSQQPHCPSLADQCVAFGGISAVSKAFTPATRLIRVHTTAIAAVKIGGKAPVAVAGLVGGTGRMTAGQTEYFAVEPGDAVAVITTT